MLTAKPICNVSKCRKVGTSVIFIQYCFSSRKRTLLNTGIAIPGNFWNKNILKISHSLPVSFGKPAELNKKIRDLIRKTEDIVDLGKRLNVVDLISFVTENFYAGNSIENITDGFRNMINEAHELKYPRKNLNLYFQIDDYINSKETKVTPGMLRIYRNMKEHLEAFEKYRKIKITFDSFDLDFYETFIDFLSFKYIQRRRKEVIYGLKINTIGKTIKQLRIFLRNRMRKKIIPEIDLSDFKITEEAVDAIYLTWGEISKIYKVDLSRFPHLVDYKNLFVLGCLTGLRFSDFSTLKLSDVRNGMLHKKQGKSEAWVVIPLRKEAQDLFNNEFKEQIPLITNAEFNRHIKTIGNLAGIKTLIEFSYKKGNKDIIVTKPKHD